MPSNSPGLAIAVPCRIVDMDNRKSKSYMDNMDNKESMSNRKKEEFPCINNVPVVVKCENGGTRNPLGQCLCPRPFYGDRCQKRLCKQYVEVKEPSRALYKRLALATPLLTRYQIIYRTRYTAATKCREDLDMGQGRQGDVVDWIDSDGNAKLK